MAQKYQLQAKWDKEAMVWVVTSPDVPGLVTTGSNLDEIAHKVRLIIPGLTEIGVEDTDEIEIHFDLKNAWLPQGTMRPKEVERLSLAA